jgi:hypothetical protein
MNSHFVGLKFSLRRIQVVPQKWTVHFVRTEHRHRNCASLRSLDIPASTTEVYGIFSGCTNLTSLFFHGNAPSIVVSPFLYDTNLTVYYLPGKTGWTSTLGGRPAVLWNPQAQTADGSFGIQNNGFGFNITASTNIPFVVEANNVLAGTNWTPLQNCAVTNGSIYFSDPDWTNFPVRFYRIRSP